MGAPPKIWWLQLKIKRTIKNLLYLLLLDNLFRTPVNDNVLKPKLGNAPLSEEKISVSGTLIFLIKHCVYIDMIKMCILLRSLYVQGTFNSFRYLAFVTTQTTGFNADWRKDKPNVSQVIQVEDFFEVLASIRTRIWIWNQANQSLRSIYKYSNEKQIIPHTACSKWWIFHTQRLRLK